MFAYYFPPSKAAGTFRTLRFVRALPDCGWKPLVLTVKAATYPEGDTDLALLHKVPDSVQVFRTPAPPLHRWFKQFTQTARSFRRRTHSHSRRQTPPATARSSSATLPPGPPSLSERLYTLLRTPDVDAGWRAFAVARGVALVWQHRPCVLYATGGPWTTFLVASDVSRLTGVPLVLDYRDPWTSNPAANRNGVFEALARRLERGPVRQARHLVANTDVLRDSLLEAHGAALASRCTIIHNSFDEADYATPPPPLPELPTFTYVGSLYEAHSPEPFLLALQRFLQQRPQARGQFQIRLVGSGASRVAQRVLQMGLDDMVDVRSPVPHAEAVALQREAHVLLLFLTVDSEHSTFVPSKLFEYIAARRPIFAVTRGGALRRLLEGRDVTPWIFAPDDVQAMADGMAELLDLARRRGLPAPSADFVRSFSGRAAARSLASVFDRVAGVAPTAPAPAHAAPEPQLATTELG